MTSVQSNIIWHHCHHWGLIVTYVVSINVDDCIIFINRSHVVSPVKAGSLLVTVADVSLKLAPNPRAASKRYTEQLLQDGFSIDFNTLKKTKKPKRKTSLIIETFFCFQQWDYYFSSMDLDPQVLLTNRPCLSSHIHSDDQNNLNHCYKLFSVWWWTEGSCRLSVPLCYSRRYVPSAVISPFKAGSQLSSLLLSLAPMKCMTATKRFIIITFTVKPLRK